MVGVCGRAEQHGLDCMLGAVVLEGGVWTTSITKVLYTAFQMKRVPKMKTTRAIDLREASVGESTVAVGRRWGP